jgi:hypothetical protein
LVGEDAVDRCVFGEGRHVAVGQRFLQSRQGQVTAIRGHIQGRSQALGVAGQIVVRAVGLAACGLLAAVFRFGSRWYRGDPQPAHNHQYRAQCRARTTQNRSLHAACVSAAFVP